MHKKTCCMSFATHESVREMHDDIVARMQHQRRSAHRCSAARSTRRSPYTSTYLAGSHRLCTTGTLCCPLNGTSIAITRASASQQITVHAWAGPAYVNQRLVLCQNTQLALSACPQASGFRSMQLATVQKQYSRADRLHGPNLW